MSAAVISFVLKIGGPVIGSIFLENLVVRPRFDFLYQPASILPFLPKAYGGVILVNVIGTAVLLIVLGFKVAAARANYSKKALKDGDADAEARFSYPKMYAEGFSDHAKQFNCVQRGHQQAFETYTQFVAMSLVAGVRFPIVSTAAGVLWILARYQWADGYATGTPSKRYDSLFAYGIWSSLIMLLAAAGTTAVEMML